MENDTGHRPPLRQSFSMGKAIFLALLLVAAGVLFVSLRRYLDLSYLSHVESDLQSFYAQNPILVLGAAFVIYLVVTGLSVPGATAMSLVFAWFFGFPRGLILVSFASTAGATLAFLLSRYLFRDWIQNRYGPKLSTFNEALEKDGPLYLFMLRLVPLVPFFVINAVMGLTRIRATTFWWVSQLGMLPGTAVYVYAGSRIPDLQTLETEGIKAIFSPVQLTQITIAFALLGLFPLLAKKIGKFFFGQQTKSDAPNKSDAKTPGQN
jgi:uncharacterized membrane protein YdjX (TVP38/TMEM64 family)